jgi:3-oxoacyl-[acyl-carrier protein] reductase
MNIIETRANLNQRRAAVIGGAGGIGKAITLALLGAGVKIALCDIDPCAVRDIKAEINDRELLLCDTAAATDPAQLKSFYHSTGESLGSLDIVVNVVGGVYMEPFLQKSANSCELDIQRNFGYVLESVRNAIPPLRQGRPGGLIINFTTIEAHRGAG